MERVRMTGRDCARRFCLAAAALVAVFAAMPEAIAQPPRSTESVTVTAPKLPPEAVIDHFVQTYAAPSPAIGKIARWRDGVCPAVAGLPKRYADFIEARVRRIAAQVGAPVQADAACAVNVQIVFTTEPQKLLDNIRKEHPLLLGFIHSPEEVPSPVFTHPVQTWYATDTEDQRGQRRPDTRVSGIGLPLTTSDGRGTVTTIYLPYAHAQSVEATRLGNGLRTDIDHVVIVAEPAQLVNQEMGGLSDYIAMLALSQTRSHDTCLPAPSIANLLSQGCDAKSKPDAITDLDLAYLRGLYRMDAGGTLLQQRGSIVVQIKKSLGGTERP
jgi:hypothetical protein